ncbi:unnamed protein product [Rotaria magnacalcarata]|uniref:Uncharacterized protein n=1 Tax=Rotaria magnacalcarata TaxID=392030 RepID=A0A816NC31_9BILA|nr:unnamed protein product [Rotaria magnacalcarata]CAF4120603.1 unnamed protein product [Rotaria magnacalcarata]
MWLTPTTMVGTVDDETYNTIKRTMTSHPSRVQPSDIYTLFSPGLKILLSVVSSTGVVCTYWCGMKWVHNGCVCKSSWFYPKSMNEYRRRKQENIAAMNELTSQQQPAISSAPSSPFPTLPIYHV